MSKHVILGLSDYGTSGIGESLRLPLTHFHNQGHEIWHLALGYTGVAASVDRNLYPWADRLIPVYPNSDSTKFGQIQIRQALETSKADVIFTSFDCWMVDWLSRPDENPTLDAATKQVLSHQNRKFSHIMYYPIDGLQQNKYLPLGIEEGILGADYPVTYSNFSQNAMQDNFNITVPMIPIPHDPNVFRPLNKKECRRKMHLDENAFIVAMVGTNQYRKCFSEFFEAVVPFAKAHNDVLICPFTTWGQIMGGTDIKTHIYKSGIQDRMIDPSNLVGRLSDEGMAIFYNALDVLCLVTVGEGAGLPPLRARACGVPALVSDNTSNVQFVGHDFERIKLRGKYFDNFGSNLERYLTDTDDLREKLEVLYGNLAFRHEVGQAGLEHMRQFEIDKIMPLWDDVLNSIPDRTEEES